MREYAKVCPSFWTRGSGKRLKPLPEDDIETRRRKRDAQLVAQYLLSGPYSNLIGLYYLPLPTICHDLGLLDEEARAALGLVEEVGFATYDEDASLVWVMNAAEIEIGRELAEFDKRRRPIIRELELAGNHPFAAMFVERYGVAYRLATPSPSPRSTEAVREGACKVGVQPSKTKPLRRVPQDQGQGQQQPQGQEQGVQGGELSEPATSSGVPPPTPPAQVLASPTQKPSKTQSPKPSRPKLAKHPIPDDWQAPPEIVERYRARGLDVGPSARRFFNHFASSRTPYARWDLTFENWIDRDVDEGKVPPYEPPTEPPKPRLAPSERVPPEAVKKLLDDLTANRPRHRFDPEILDVGESAFARGEHVVSGPPPPESLEAWRAAKAARSAAAGEP